MEFFFIISLLYAIKVFYVEFPVISKIAQLF